MSTSDTTSDNADRPHRTLGQRRAAKASDRTSDYKCAECNNWLTESDTREYGHARHCPRRPEVEGDASAKTLAEFCQ